jgi:hypothetical protein
MKRYRAQYVIYDDLYKAAKCQYVRYFENGFQLFYFVLDYHEHISNPEQLHDRQ